MYESQQREQQNQGCPRTQDGAGLSKVHALAAKGREEERYRKHTLGLVTWRRLVDMAGAAWWSDGGRQLGI